jgi:bifunctional DNase/RNase
MIEMQVKGLALEASSRQPMIILTDSEEKHFLPIFIGFQESDAILLALEKIPVPRPVTHDLMKNILEVTGLKLERVAITRIEERIFYATLVLQAGEDKQFEVDCRPSDGIALALRVGAPVFASESVMKEAAILDPVKYQKEMEDFRKFLDQVKPSDFSKYDERPPGWQPPEENKDD